MTDKEYIKVKYVIMEYCDETVNAWAQVSRNSDGTYQLVFDDGESFDNCTEFNPIDRKFHMT